MTAPWARSSLVVLALLFAPGAPAGGLEDDLGRTETRVRSATFPLVAGSTVAGSALLERLERLGYRRVHAKPTEPGTFFYGHETFWFFRDAHRVGGRDHEAQLFGLTLRRADGRILGAIDARGLPRELKEGSLWLEPETLSESLTGDRAQRLPVRLEALPEHVWRGVLAAEDARFFEHMGVDARSVARAALANLKSGGVVQGGSTITQQLVKNRDLSPKRSMGRKASEAARALWLEVHYDKGEILEAYLNQVYLGNVEGLAVHGIGAAARVYFSKPAERLTLAESATLAAMIQGPNRLSPRRHPQRVRERRDWVLSRLEELGWAEPNAVRSAKRSAIRLDLSPPVHSAPVHFLSWVASDVKAEVPDRIENGRGVVVETTLDPHLQRLATHAVRDELRRLRRSHSRLRDLPLQAALVTLDARTGGVLAYVGGDPEAPGDGFDRIRRARRQPGSAVKPFVLLEAFEDCGARAPLYPASRIADRPLTLELPSGDWRPENYDRTHRGIVTARTTLVDSLNVPAVRIGRWCGFDATARLFRSVGLDLPDAPPPSFVLGSVETTPLELARAYTVIATPGRLLTPFAVSRLEKPEGRRLGRTRPRGRRVVRPATAYLVRDVMIDAVRDGTAAPGRIEGVDVAAKTGSSSGLRDAWFAGHAGSLVTVVWVGLDDSTPLGLTGSRAAGPVWREFMEAAVPARPEMARSVPKGVVRDYLDPETGLRVGARNRRAESELFRKGALPPRDRFWRVDRSVPIVE